MLDLKQSYLSDDLETFKIRFQELDKESLKKEIADIFHTQYYEVWEKDKSIEEKSDIVINDKLAYILQYDKENLNGECKKAWIQDLEEIADEIYNSLYAMEVDKDYDFCELIEFYGEDYEQYLEEKDDDERHREYEDWREGQNWLEHAIIEKLENI